MAFTSFNFLLFFPVTVVLYFISPQKYRMPFLLLASYFFYLNTKPVYAVLLAGVTVTTYSLAILIDTAKPEKLKKRLLLAGIIIILLPLFCFKYFNFVNNGIFTLLDHMHLRWPLPDISLLLPVGISFYTFMALGYLIDVYNEDIRAEKNIGVVALFLSFFPVVLSGPIERATNMFHQFKDKLLFNYSMAVSGLQFMLWGYFMKLVIADRAAIYIDAVFSNVYRQTGSSLLLASLLQPIRIYGDLGGYSLIAIGCAKIMGINIIPNFKRPFFAPTMSEFWRRWHISLIKWLTDYIYTPLSFSFRRFGIKGIVLALMFTFIISGVWHGAAVCFIVWGFIQGVILSIETLTRKKRDQFEKKYNLTAKGWYIFLSCVFTYCLMAFSLIFGAAHISLAKVFYILKKIFTNLFQLPYIDGSTLLYTFLGFGILFVKEFMEEYYPGRILLFGNSSKVIRWSAYYFILLFIIFLGVFGSDKFVYFQF